MMRYYVRVPAAAIKASFDGHSYAYVGHRVTPDGIQPCEPRMVRADDAPIRNGEALIYIGAMGDAIAQRSNLPYAVEMSE